MCPLTPEQGFILGAGLFSASAAERVTSLGKDWHRPCLKCEKCGKTLTSGGHAEVGGAWRAAGAKVGAKVGADSPSRPFSLQHEGKPYCNHPCYASMFGPKGRLPRPLTPPPPPRPWTP